MIFADVYYILIFYLTGTLFALAGFAVVKSVFADFPDKGYILAKIFGLLGVSFVMWTLTYVFKLPYTSAAVVFVLLAFITVGVVANRAEFFADLRKNLKFIAGEEILFACFFGLMLIYRSAVPQIVDIEKFMDFAILNGLYRTEQLPPQDVWFSGNTINYYYFGHFILTTMNKVTHIPLSTAYNLNVAYIFALTAGAGFSIVLALTRSRIASVLSGLLLVAAGNMDLMVNQLIKGNANYFYADARSLIPNAITEFPSYSFIISDLHAHIINLPFVLLFIGILVALAQNISLLKSRLVLLLASASLGALGVINSWDYFVYTALMFTVLLIAFARSEKHLKNAVIKSALYTAGIAGGGLLLFFNYYLDFRPAVSGVGFALESLGLQPTLRMFGYFSFGAVSFIAYLLVCRKKTHTDLIAIGFLLVGVMLILLPNFVYLKDIYSKLNPPFYRANSVFKIWYQAWVVLAIFSAYAFYKVFTFLISRQSYLLFVIYFGVFSFMTFWVFKYPVISVNYVLGSHYVYKGLDGQAYLNDQSPDDLVLINWLNANVHGQTVLLEATGKSYSRYSLISAYTGLPTVVGWDEHELGWRDNWPEIAQRLGDVEKLYISDSLTEVQRLVEKYNVKYVVIGNREKERYGETAGKTINQLAKSEVVFNTTKLLRIAK